MSTALFLITHEGIASNLLNIAESILHKTSDNLSYIEVPMGADREDSIGKAKHKLKLLSIEDGLIFITDVYGSTPSNIAKKLADQFETRLISGINLPMLIRLLNYRDNSLEELIQIALDGAHKGIRED